MDESIYGGNFCESGEFQARSERLNKLRMVRLVNQNNTICAEEMCQRQKDWDEVDGQKWAVDSRDNVGHIKNDEFFAMRMTAER